MSKTYRFTSRHGDGLPATKAMEFEGIQIIRLYLGDGEFIFDIPHFDTMADSLDEAKAIIRQKAGET